MARAAGRIVDAPVKVKSYLCSRGFHKIAVGTAATAQKGNLLANDKSLHHQAANGKKQHKLMRVFTPQQVLNVSFSMYSNKQMSVSHVPLSMRENPRCGPLSTLTGHNTMQISLDDVRSARVIMHGDDSKLDDLKREVRQFEAQEADVRRELEELERKDATLRSENTQAQQLKKDLTEEKAMYNTKQADALIKTKEQEVKQKTLDLEREKQKLPELERKAASMYERRFNELAKLKSLSDKVCARPSAVVRRCRHRW
jgi:DNA repair exonuclease SbcCD ATPase subunit